MTTIMNEAVGIYLVRKPPRELKTSCALTTVESRAAKIYLSPMVALAAVHSKAVVLILLIHCCSHYLVRFCVWYLFCNAVLCYLFWCLQSFRWKRGSWLVFLIVFSLSRGCYGDVSFPRCAAVPFLKSFRFERGSWLLYFNCFITVVWLFLR